MTSLPLFRSLDRPGRGLRRPGGWLRPALVVVAVVAMSVAAAAPGAAITGGQPDGRRHPYVGGMVLYYAPADETIVNCTGSLISSTVFLTAAHCGIDGMSVSITFDEVFDPATSPQYQGTFHAHPDYDPAQEAQSDVAVIVLDAPMAGVNPTRLPRLPGAGLLDRMKDAGTLNQSTRFTSVGYGQHSYVSGPGGQTPVYSNARYYSVGSFNSLSQHQLHLSQNAAHGDGGTCDGDSGGPNFLGAGTDETLVIAGLTSTGETYCKATNVTYRVDTPAARQFLASYVTLP